MSADPHHLDDRSPDPWGDEKRLEALDEPETCPKCDTRPAVRRLSPIGTLYLDMCDECLANHDGPEPDYNADGPAERAHKADKALRERRG